MFDYLHTEKRSAGILWVPMCAYWLLISDFFVCNSFLLSSSVGQVKLVDLCHTE